jgi:putative ABC transport system permease protein
MLRLLRLFAARRARARMALSIAGIALGVALGYGVHLVNRAAVGDVAAAVRSIAGTADLEVRGGRGGFAETLYPKIARLPGVAVASPALELDAGIAGTERTLRITGVDILRSAVLQPQLVTEDRYELLSADRVFLSVGAAEALGLGKGDVLKLVAGQETVELKIVQVLASLRGVSALTDIATAQWRFGRLGELNRIDLRLAAGAERETVRREIQALLPPGVHATAIETLEEASAYPSRSYRVNLNVLAMVALFTGGFLVFSAQALEMARRRGEHALLRVLGLRRSGISWLVLAEAAALGALGAAAGLALGYALALVAVRYAGADLGAGMFRGGSAEIVLSVPGMIFYLAAGIGVAVLGALLPALDAARTPPARALKAGDEQALFQRAMPLWPGLVLLILGAALTQMGPVGELPVFGYAAIACLLVGAVVLVPRLAQWVFAALPLTA